MSSPKKSKNKTPLSAFILPNRKEKYPTYTPLAKEDLVRYLDPSIPEPDNLRMPSNPGIGIMHPTRTHRKDPMNLSDWLDDN